MLAFTKCMLYLIVFEFYSRVTAVKFVPVEGSALAGEGVVIGTTGKQCSET